MREQTLETIRKNDARDANRDPLSGEVGAHPVGVGVGAAAGGMAVGAAVGVVAGPIGMAVGAALGAIAGGLVGKGAAEMVDPTADDAYWRDNYTTRAYVNQVHSYEDYAPAYRYGGKYYALYGDRGFEAAEADMAESWEIVRGESTLSWADARPALRDAWDRAKARATLR